MVYTGLVNRQSLREWLDEVRADASNTTYSLVVDLDSFRLHDRACSMNLSVVHFQSPNQHAIALNTQTQSFGTNLRCPSMRERSR